LPPSTERQIPDTGYSNNCHCLGLREVGKVPKSFVWSLLLFVWLIMSNSHLELLVSRQLTIDHVWQRCEHDLGLSINHQGTKHLGQMWLHGWQRWKGLGWGGHLVAHWWLNPSRNFHERGMCLKDISPIRRDRFLEVYSAVHKIGSNSSSAPIWKIALKNRLVDLLQCTDNEYYAWKPLLQSGYEVMRNENVTL